MKFKNILIVSLILAILTIGAVSASDNSTSDDIIAQEELTKLENNQDASDALNQENQIEDVEISQNSSEGVLTGEDPILYANVPICLVDEEIYIEAYINPDAEGKLSLYVDNKKIRDNILDEVQIDGDIGYFEPSNYKLNYGKHTMQLKFAGDEKYNPATYSTSFYYSYFGVEYNSWRTYHNNYGNYGEGIYLNNLFYEDDIKMDMKVYVDGKLVFDKKNVGPSKKIALTNLNGLQHSIKVVASGNGKNYPPLTVNANFIRDILPIVEINKLMILSSDNYLTVTLPSDANGILKVYIDGIDVNATMSNGKSKVSLKNLGIGMHDIHVVYTNDSQYPNYDSQKDDANEDFELQVISEGFTVTQSDIIRTDNKNEIMFNGPNEDIDGYFEISYKGNPVGSSERYENGTAKGHIYMDETGDHELKYTFSKFGGGEISGTFKVKVFPNKPQIYAKNFKIDYSSKTKFKVQILDKDYNKVVGKTVTFVFYGSDEYDDKKVKITKTVKTDANGYAKVQFNVAPGEYKVQIKFADAKTVTKKYIVNSIVKPTKIYKKHSRIKTKISKTFQFGASLKKVDGKYLKGKKIKLTFYRQGGKKVYNSYFGRLTALKTVTLTTNSKGVAKITYKKLPFKLKKPELEGLLIIVKISYLKENQYSYLNVHSLSPIKYYFI